MMDSVTRVHIGLVNIYPSPGRLRTFREIKKLMSADISTLQGLFIRPTLINGGWDLPNVLYAPLEILLLGSHVICGPYTTILGTTTSLTLAAHLRTARGTLRYWKSVICEDVNQECNNRSSFHFPNLERFRILSRIAANEKTNSATLKA